MAILGEPASQMYGSVFCLVPRLASSKSRQVNMQATKATFLSGQRETFCFAFKRKLKRLATKQREIKCKRRAEAKLSHAPQIEIVSLGLRLSKATTTGAQQKCAKMRAEKGQRGHVLKALFKFSALVLRSCLASVGQRLSDIFAHCFLAWPL